MSRAIVPPDATNAATKTKSIWTREQVHPPLHSIIPPAKRGHLDVVHLLIVISLPRTCLYYKTNIEACMCYGRKKIEEVGIVLLYAWAGVSKK